jgi:hypothetical protein
VSFLTEALFSQRVLPTAAYPEISPDRRRLKLLVIAGLQATVSADYLPLLAPRNSGRSAELLISVTTQGSGMGLTPLVCASDGSWAKLDCSAASRPARAKTRGAVFQPLGGSLLPRGLLWYSTKLKNILGDFGNRPGFRSSLHEHIGFHDLATDWPQ